MSKVICSFVVAILLVVTAVCGNQVTGDNGAVAERRRFVAEEDIPVGNKTFWPLNTDAPDHTVNPEMTWKGWVFLTVVVVVFLALWRNVAPMFSIMASSTVFFYITTILDHQNVFVGLTNNGVLSIALLCVVVHPISELPLLKHTVRVMMRGSGSAPSGTGYNGGRGGGGSPTVGAGQGSTTAVRFPLFKLCLLCFIISPFLENTPHIAVFTPLVTEFCKDNNLSPSQFLMPMTFAVILGNYLTISASPNLIISGMMEEAKLGSLPMWELAKVNLPLMIPAMLYLVFMPAYLLPKRRGGQSFICRVKVGHESPLIGKLVGELMRPFLATRQEDFEKITINRMGNKIAEPHVIDEVLTPGDELIIVGLISSLSPQAAPELLEAVVTTDSSPTSKAFLPTLVPEAFAADDGDSATDGLLGAANFDEIPQEHHEVAMALLGSSSGMSAGPSRAASFNRGGGSGKTTSPLGQSPKADYMAHVDAVSAGATREAASTTEAVQGVLGVVDESQPISPRVIKAGAGASLRNAGSKYDSFSSNGASSLLADTMSLELFVIVMSAVSPLVSHTEKIRAFAHKFGVMVLALKTSIEGNDLSQEDIAAAAPNLASGEATSSKVPEHVQQEWKSVEQSVHGSAGHGSKVAFHAPLTTLTPGFIHDPKTGGKTFFLITPVWVPFGTRIGGQENPRKVVHLPDWYQYMSLIVFLGVMIAAILGIHLAHASLVGCCGMVLLGLTSTREVVKRLPVDTFILTSMSLPLGIAMRESGFAGVLGQAMVRMNITGFQLLLFIGSLTILLTNLITNQGAVQVLFPLVMKVYQVQRKHPMSGIAMLASTVGVAFCTPFGAPAIAIIVAPGRYGTPDLMRFGLPISIMLIPALAVMCAAVYDDW